jgi:hypothetical protein
MQQSRSSRKTNFSGGEAAKLPGEVLGLKLGELTSVVTGGPHKVDVTAKLASKSNEFGNGSRGRSSASFFRLNTRGSLEQTRPQRPLLQEISEATNVYAASINDRRWTLVSDLLFLSYYGVPTLSGSITLEAAKCSGDRGVLGFATKRVQCPECSFGI